MALLGRRMLGLAMEERRIIAAEVQLSGQRAELRRAAEFNFPQGVSLDDPQPLGKALGEFLRGHRFSAKNAVIGVPARWLLSKEKAFPPASASSLSCDREVAMIRLEAERSFATDLDDLLLDYANGRETPHRSVSTQGNGPRILVMALSRDKGDRLTAMALAAGLKPKALTASSMVLAAALRPASPSSVVLAVRPGHVEVCIRSGGRFRAVRHLPVAVPANAGAQATAPAGWGRTVADEIRRLTVVLPQDDADAAPEVLVVWNGAGMAPDDLDGLGAPLSLETDLSSGLPDLGIVPSPDVEDDCSAVVAAAALALAGARNGGNGRRLPVDFIHSRLAARGKTRLGRRIALIGAAALVALAAVGFLFADWRRSERELAGLRTRLDAMKPDVEAARSVVQRIALARGWTDQRPRFLEPLRELSLAFPSDGGIWVTNIAMREDMRTVVSGKSADKQTVLDTLDRIRATEPVAGRRAFSNVKLVYMRDAGATTREIAFSMSFDFSYKE